MLLLTAGRGSTNCFIVGCKFSGNFAKFCPEQEIRNNYTFSGNFQAFQETVYQNDLHLCRFILHDNQRIFYGAILKIVFNADILISRKYCVS